MIASDLMIEPANQDSFSFIDLFAGIGGMRRGFEAIGGECVFTSEWDTKAQATYRANHGEEAIAGDITQIDAAEIPNHDVLLAGFPCQPFSIAGVSKKNSLGRAHGFDCDTQGTLFFDVERIIAAHRPAAFVLENVKNLRSHDHGRTFAVVENVLTEKLGYHFEWRVLDARAFVPQHRERIFLVGFREETRFDFDSLMLPDAAPKIGSILHPQDASEQAETPFTQEPGGVVNPKYTLTPKLWEYLQRYAAKHKAAGNGFGFGMVGPDDVSRTLSARYYKDGSEILIRQSGGCPRRLTPRECARLMGFDKPRGAQWRIPVSDTQAYKQFGNAVVPQVVEVVARHMEPHLRGLLAGEITAARTGHRSVASVSA